MTLLLLLSCVTPGEGPRALHDVEGDFFDHPWPSDLRATPRGGLDLSGFPEEDEIALLETYRDVAAELSGSGLNAPVFFRFEGPLDEDLLPSPSESLDPSASLLLINIDARSEAYGELTPVQWRFSAEETAYQPENLLAVGPLFGHPLLPGTRYAAVVTAEVARPARALRQVWSPDHQDYDHWAGLQQALFSLDLSTERVAAATIFTTQDPFSELIDYAHRVHSLDSPDWSQPLRRVQDYDSYGWSQLEGWLHLPLWQHGEKPYASEGGGFKRDAEGLPLMHSWEKTAFTLAIPQGEAPEKGWPVVLYSHGTGGDHDTCCNSGDDLEVATVLTQAGFAVMGVAQPLHGDRGTADTLVELHSFNYANPAASRSTFRQSALDLVYLTRGLSEGVSEFTLDDAPLLLNPEEVSFMGHSQGGITGAMALPFMAGHARAAVLSGAGGGLALSMAYREDGIEGFEGGIPELIGGLLGFEEDEVLDELHPVSAVVQALGELTDPLNYAPYWFQAPLWSQARPLHVLLTEGKEDAQTPAISTEALAAAAGLDRIGETFDSSEALELAGSIALGEVAGGNQLDWEGEPITALLAQYSDRDHFAVFYDQGAATLYRDFLAGALGGEAPGVVRVED